MRYRIRGTGDLEEGVFFGDVACMGFCSVGFCEGLMLIRLAILEGKQSCKIMNMT